MDLRKINFLVVVFFLSINCNVLKAENSISLKEYLDKENIEKGSTQIYLLNRCSAIYAYASAIILKSDEKNSKKFIDIANSLLFKSVELRIIDNQDKLENAKKIAEDERSELFKKYKKDGEINWKKNKSFFKGSYISQDMSICAKLVDDK
jgi:hypothetical protein|tara:strand:- start:3747 stop:4196 length:450 start_codon:yes stop_codon:yes gene_type:complete